MNKNNLDIVDFIEKENLYRAKVIISVYNKKYKYTHNEIALGEYYTRSFILPKFAHLLEDNELFEKIDKNDITIKYDSFGNRVIQIKGESVCSDICNGRIRTHGFDTYKTLEECKQVMKKQILNNIEKCNNQIKSYNDRLKELGGVS